jgi:prolyl-tRNA synthetase
VLRGRKDMFTGANTDDVHVRGVDVDRDITVGQWADLREAVAGDPCVQCGKPLRVDKAIEVGHIFKLGYKYADALNATVLDAAGNRTKIIMGSYGIGVERAMAAVVECHHDGKGIVWPMAVAPFHAAIVVTQPEHEATAATAERIYQQLLAVGIDVIIDDRAERAGVKFRDVELVGIPLRITVGSRNLADGAVELTERESGSTEKVSVDEVVERVRKAVESAGLPVA